MSKYFQFHNSSDGSYIEGTIKELGIDTTNPLYDPEERSDMAKLQGFIDNSQVGDVHTWVINPLTGEMGTLTLLELIEKRFSHD